MGRGRLRLGASVSICHLLPPVLRIRESFPDYRISIQPGAPTPFSMTCPRIAWTGADLGRASQNLDFVPVFEDELVFLVAPNHPWVAQGNVVRGNPTQNYILFNKGSLPSADRKKPSRANGPQNLIERQRASKER
jgi:DNA-binding transcriptional LysR family regulator